VEVEAVNEHAKMDNDIADLSDKKTWTAYGDQTVPKKAGPRTTTHKFYTLGQLRSSKFADRRFLLSPWLREQESSMVYAASGVGKSLFAMSAAIAIAGGGEFFGWKPEQRANGKPWKVFYVDGEMHIADLQERGETLIAACPGVNQTAANANLRLFARQDQKDGSLFPLISTEAGMAFYEDRARHVDLMIFDNFSTLGEVEDENSASEFNAVTEFLLRLKARGVATMLVHHANKAGDNFRGSSKLAATFETIVKLEKPESDTGAGDIDDARFRVAWQKVRAGGRQLRPVMARLVTDQAFGDETGAPAKGTEGQLLGRRWEFVAGELSLYDEMRKGLSEGKFVTPAEIAAFRGVNKSTVSRQLERGEKLGLWTGLQLDQWFSEGKRKRRAKQTQAPVQADRSWREDATEDPDQDF
jgi:AAA domain